MGARKKPNYAEALAELEEIVSGIESESIDVDHLTEQVKRARYLISYCKGRLRSTEESVKKVLSEIETGEGEETGKQDGSENDTEKEEPRDKEQDLF
jgi:exodeoxyribonuclease VII small subunit